MLCRSLFLFLSIFFWPLCCLSFDLRILISLLVCSNSSDPHVLVGGFICYVYYLYLFAYYKWYQPRLDLHIGSPPFLVRSVLLILLTFCVMYLCFVCLLPVSWVSNVAMAVDCPFLIAPSVFSNVYFLHITLSLHLNLYIL